MAKVATIQGIIKEARNYLPNLNEEKVMRAYEVAKTAHSGQKRASGEDYIVHPLEVTKILLTLKPDEDSIVASLLHDVLEDTDVKIDTLQAEFGDSIMPLLKGLEKLSTVYYRGRERQVENLRKMFLAMAKDIRVILIKLADRLHNMRTLNFMPEDKQKRIAQETLTVYAPIAARLGIYRIKNELDELGFKFSNPDEYEHIAGDLKKVTDLQKNIIKTSTRILNTVLKKAGIKLLKIDGRVKNPFSIYRKLRRKDKNYVNELYDILAMRVVVPDEAMCYQVLGILHKNWTPLSNRFKDYIGHPKPNGYRSLHTTLVGLCPDLNNQPIEIQIRSQEMDEVAKFGIAAHWQYKEKGASAVVVPKEKLMWIQNLVDLHKNLVSNVEFIDTLAVDTFEDRIFVLTPHGDIKDLPFGATPVDFAYAVHTEVGHKTKGAKVNGKIVPLDYKLHSGQAVEIITGNIPKPNRYWLSFAITTHAQSSIKQWFNTQDRDKLLKMGKELINDQLKRFDQPLLDPSLSLFKTYMGKKLTLKEREFLMEKIGNGSVNASTVVRKVINIERPISPVDTYQERKEIIDIPEILVTGEKGLKTTIATCCSPKPSDEIVGYVTRGRGVSIHKKDCSALKGNDPDRLVNATWSIKKTYEFMTHLIIKRRSRIGLLRDITTVFANHDLYIIDLHHASEGEYEGDINVKFGIDDMETLDLLIYELEKVDGVIFVKEKIK